MSKLLKNNERHDKTTRWKKKEKKRKEKRNKKKKGSGRQTRELNKRGKCFNIVLGFLLLLSYLKGMGALFDGLGWYPGMVGGPAVCGPALERRIGLSKKAEKKDRCSPSPPPPRVATRHSFWRTSESNVLPLTIESAPPTPKATKNKKEKKHVYKECHFHAYG